MYQNIIENEIKHNVNILILIISNYNIVTAEQSNSKDLFISDTTVSQWNVVTPQHLKSKISTPLRTPFSELTLNIIFIIFITRNKMLMTLVFFFILSYTSISIKYWLA